MVVINSRIREKIRQLSSTEDEAQALLDILEVVLEQQGEKRVQWRKRIAEILETFADGEEI